MLFDSYVMIDWSGANSPRTGKDSIWVAILSRRQNRLRLAHLKNLSTRCEATLPDRISDNNREGWGASSPVGALAGGLFQFQ